MSMLLGVAWRLLVVLALAVFMEGVAWFTHKYVMHGFLWVLHEDHHYPKGRGWQKNDLFALMFALPSFLLMLFGSLNGFNLLFWVGTGIALYGLGYFGFHDVIFHRRIRINYRPTTGYMGRIIRAHATHHRSSTAHSGISFGFLYAPKKYAA